MNSGKIVAGRVDGTGRDGTSKVLQEVLADLKTITTLIVMQWKNTCRNNENGYMLPTEVRSANSHSVVTQVAPKWHSSDTKLTPLGHQSETQMTSEKSLSQGGYKSLAELFKERQKEKRALIVVRCPLLSHAWPHSAPGKFSQPSSFHSYFFTRIYFTFFSGR